MKANIYIVILSTVINETEWQNNKKELDPGGIQKVTEFLLKPILSHSN